MSDPKAFLPGRRIWRSREKSAAASSKWLNFQVQDWPICKRIGPTYARPFSCPPLSLCTVLYV